MSKARLVIIAVVVEGRSQSATARQYGVSQGWSSRLVARYHRDGEAAFQPRSAGGRSAWEWIAGLLPQSACAAAQVAVAYGAASIRGCLVFGMPTFDP
jgi:hypothetical protein